MVTAGQDENLLVGLHVIFLLPSLVIRVVLSGPPALLGHVVFLFAVELFLHVLEAPAEKLLLNVVLNEVKLDLI